MTRTGLEAAVANATYTPEGWATPAELLTNAAEFFAASNWSEMVRHVHDIAGGRVLTAPTVSDLTNLETGPLLEKYMRTEAGVDATDRMRLFHAIRDFTADSYGGWPSVTALQGGGLYARRLAVEKHFDMDRAKALALGVAGMGDRFTPA